MRKLPALLLLWCSLFLAFPLNAAETPATKSVSTWDIDQLMTALSGVSGGSKRFVEKKYLSMLNEPLVMSGTLSYTAPSRLEKHILVPNDESFIVDNGTLQIDNPAKNLHRRFALQSYPAIWAFVESFRATLAGDTKSLRRFYTVTLNGDKKKWELTLLPLDPSMLKAVSAIRIKGQADRITSMETLEVNGDHSVMSIEDIP